MGQIWVLTDQGCAVMSPRREQSSPGVMQRQVGVLTGLS